MSICEGKTFRYSNASIISYGSTAGKVESEGPFGDEFDEIIKDNKGGADTWEQAEALFQQKALKYAMDKAGLVPEKMDLIFAGDLLNVLRRILCRFVKEKPFVTATRR